MIIVLVLLVVAVVIVGAVLAAALGGAGAGRGTLGRGEAERLANLEAERLLGQRYRDGEITLAEFERDLAGVLERRERRDTPGS
ncbi:MAG: hypothetical protein RIB67_01450 [Miltoncostaeaceae bacterium]